VALPESVALKFGAYTLACHHVVERLPALDRVTLRDTRCSTDSLAAIVDEALKVFFVRASPTDLAEACVQLTDLLRSQANLFRNTSPRAAEVFDELVAAILAASSAWDYRTEIQRLHLLGRDLARRFYAGSPYAATQERCQRVCSFALEYGAADEVDDRASARCLSFGYQATPMAFRPQANEIVMRFSFEGDLKLYLAYPFLFLHEYSAHIYATDHHNARFNDGWMLYAADVLLRRGWRTGDLLIAPMPRQRVQVFQQRLASIIGASDPLVQRGLQFAQDFEAWLPTPQWFDAITYELAAFEPGAGRRKFWPTDFLNRLEQEFLRDRPALRDKLLSATTASDLYFQLAAA
jgi:hypothetical protein